jgi:hypothetical protein
VTTVVPSPSGSLPVRLLPAESTTVNPAPPTVLPRSSRRVIVRAPVASASTALSCAAARLKSNVSYWLSGVKMLNKRKRMPKRLMTGSIRFIVTLLGERF